ncbi:MAG: ASKHA domain-containing protein [Planctomycetota bacterium]|jgi:uncharacterized 2Fe-2S/4Fe-4S cluster protein (DUF4445 family)
MRQYKVTFKPNGLEVLIHGGATILEAAGRAGLALNTVCGGAGTCGKCMVEIEANGQKVLACQHRVNRQLEIVIPPQARFFEPRILAHGMDRGITIGPAIRKKFPEFRDPAVGIFGAAVDIGTTTLVAKLIDLGDGSCKATAASVNPQTAWGDDVITRITYAQKDDGLEELHGAIIEGVGGLVDELCKKAGVTPWDVCELIAVGNTTMNHLFLKFPVKQLGQAPFKPYSTEAHDKDAGHLNLNMNPSGNVHMVENIAGFVGSDTLAAALALGMDTVEKMTLVVDIGTNGEIILGTKDKMYAASCAAGPAFEGARISCGSRAEQGAIEGVIVADDDIELVVIGNCEPKSICGSGLVDIVAILLNLGLVDRSGAFVDPAKIKSSLSTKVMARLIKHKEQRAFVLADNKDNDNDPVILTQQDVRETQLAKGAVRAGLQSLQQKVGIRDKDIEQVLLAGAFGNYIRRESALRIGLLPAVPEEKIHFVGNAAVVGAQMVLVSTRCRKLCGKLAAKIEYVETANDPDFQNLFAEAIPF